MNFDTEKAERIAKGLLDILEREKATAGEACAAISFAYTLAINFAPTDEEKKKIRNTIMQAIIDETADPKATTPAKGETHEDH